jgi:KDO2-lipid IV(A) lauroyltransferase
VSNEWQYYTIKALSKLTCLLPYSVITSWGRSLGPVVGKLLKKQRNRGVFHVMRGLECSETEANRIIDALFRNLGQSLMEILYTSHLTPENISHYVTIDHPERIAQALAENKGVIILTGHIGNWEWMGAALSLYGYPSTTIVKRQPNDQVTRFLNENREMMGLEVFARGGSEMIGAARALKRKKLLGFLADQDGGFHGVPQPFLGKMSSTPVGPAMFAQKFHSPIVPVFAIHGEHHENKIIVGEPLYYEDTGDKDADITRITRKMAVLTEQFIKDHPTDWLWFQHRWSTEPEEIIALQQKQEGQSCENRQTEEK